MPYSSQRDRTPSPLELSRSPWPFAPLNLTMSGFNRPGTIDLQWSDPTQIARNALFVILGVNLYRSIDSEFGPYERITPVPLGSLFWRDQTDNELVVEEDVSGRFSLRGAAGTGIEAPRYVFKTLHTPIIKEGSQAVPADSPLDVEVRIDGTLVGVTQVYGPAGEVEINSFPYFDVATQTQILPLLPGDNSRVTCTYRYSRSNLPTDLGRRIFYRATTVGFPAGNDIGSLSPTDLVETPLEQAAATSSFELEKLDFIWKEAVRRNRFILEQGGERVKLFVQKSAGLPCPCIPDSHHNQPISDCLICFGAGFVGGYEGPFDILVAPQDAEKRIAQTDRGRTVQQTYEVWTGPSPLISQRDFVVKRNGDRFLIGPVRNPSNRGMVLQQHFNLSSFDEGNIRYKVPITDPVKYVATQFAPSGPEGSAAQGPTNKPEIPIDRQLVGLTETFDNIEY